MWLSRAEPPLRLVLLRHPGTTATREARLPRDEPATHPVGDLSDWSRRGGTVITSPARRCRVDGAPVEPLLRPWDLGSWSGRRVDEVPDMLAWRTQPSYAGHGGESLLGLLERAGSFLHEHQSRTGRLAAVTHGAVIRAVLVDVLRAAPEAFWTLDVAPGAVTELRASGSGWRVSQVNVPSACSSLTRRGA